MTDTALRDIQFLDKLAPGFPVSGAFIAATDDMPLSLRLFHLGSPIALSERVPMLENMGFRVIDERSYEIVPDDERGPIWLHDMAIAPADDAVVDVERLGGPLFAAFLATWFGHAENDGYNALVLHAGLGWREVALLRTVSRYLRQAGAAYSQSYMAETLVRHAGIARMTMRHLDPGFIGRYLSRVGEEALTSVGAYQIEGEGIQLFEKIEGDYFTIVGLPLLPVLKELRALGAIDG